MANAERSASAANRLRAEIAAKFAPFVSRDYILRHVWKLDAAEVARIEKEVREEALDEFSAVDRLSWLADETCRTGASRG